MESLSKIARNRIINSKSEFEKNCCINCEYSLGIWFLCLNCLSKICEECKFQLDQQSSKSCKKCGNSSKYFRKEIDILKTNYSLNLRCINYEYGCNDILSGSKLISHEELCPFQLFTCPNEGCLAEKLFLKDRMKHEEECIYQPLQCPECNIPILRIEKDSHLKEECIINLNTCLKCSQSVKNITISKHLEECSKKIETCDKCLLPLVSNHDCVSDLKKYLIDAKINSVNSIKNIRKDKDILFEELSISNQKLVDQQNSVNEKFCQITNLFNEKINNLINVNENLQNEIGEIKNSLENTTFEVKKTFQNLKSEIFAFKNEVKEDVLSIKKNHQFQNESIQDKVNQNNMDSVIKFNSDSKNKIENNVKPEDFINLNKTIEIQENKIQQLVQDYMKFQYNFPLEYSQKIDIVKSQCIFAFKELREQSHKLAEDLFLILNIFHPLSERNIKRLKEYIKYIYRKKYVDEEIYENKEEKEKNKYLFYVERKDKSFSNFLHLINLETSQTFNYELFQNSSYLNDAVWFKDLIFICGGGHENKFLNICAILDIPQNRINTDCNLTQKKCFVNLVASLYFVMCIGGYNGKSLSSCEIFTIKDLQWIQTASLNKSQERVTSIYHHPSFIFTLGSCIDNCMEKLDINGDFKNWKWEILKVKGLSRSYGCAIKLKLNEILIFGGESSCQAFCTFNSHKNILRYRDEKFCEISFNSSKPVYFNGLIWIVCDSEKKIYQISPEIFNFESKGLYF